MTSEYLKGAMAPFLMSDFGKSLWRHYLKFAMLVNESDNNHVGEWMNSWTQGRYLAVSLLLASQLGLATAAHATTELASMSELVGKWQCLPDEKASDKEESWVNYDFHHDGKVNSKEWIRYQDQGKTELEFNLFVDYHLESLEGEYRLKPLSMKREILTDPNQANPFGYDAQRDLMGYRIFLQPVMKGKNKAQFEMWYHITPQNHFSMQCQRQAA